jgi:glycine/D-amino acid oxidase-like deaminating enzyme
MSAALTTAGIFMATSPHILVIGAGIIGASIAWHLAKAGARVTILEAAQPGGVATRNSWAWINASWGNPEPYFRLRIRSMAEWRRLAQEIPNLRVNWSGGLLWDMPRADLETFAQQHAAWGYAIRRLDRAEIQALEPALADPPDFALHMAEEGALDPLAATSALLSAAVDLGAVLRRGRAQALVVTAGRITGVVTQEGRLDADMVVVAAGAGTAALAATADVHVPMETPPGLLVVTQPHERLLNGLVMAPAMHVRQMEDGRLIAGADFGGSDPGADAGATAREVFGGLQKLLVGGAALAFDHHKLGYRPTPRDGFPVVGAVPGRAGLYIAVMHSGITLAPAVGRFATEEILTGADELLLAPYRLARFI